MRTYEGDINTLYPRIIEDIMDRGDDTYPRGKVCRELNPVSISLLNPRRRLITSYGRPVNISFALAEVLWILSGRNDVGMLQHYNSNIGDYSDDGHTFNAAYGNRLRSAYGHDQIDDAIKGLRADPESRQASLVIAHPGYDRNMEPAGHPRAVKDRACNVYSHAMIRREKLNWMQVLRSNDALWGVPYNLIQWTHIQEFIASRTDVEMGTYTHVADSLHIYDYHFPEARTIGSFDLYDVLGHDHAAMNARDNMDLLYHLETEIRTAFKAGDMSYLVHNIMRQWDGGIYWADVLHNLVGFALYKMGEDREAAKWWASGGDHVYNLASIRFAWSNRWHKDEYGAARDTVWDTLAVQGTPGAVLDWIQHRAEA